MVSKIQRVVQAAQRPVRRHVDEDDATGRHLSDALEQPRLVWKRLEKLDFVALAAKVGSNHPALPLDFAHKLGAAASEIRGR